MSIIVLVSITLYIIPAYSETILQEGGIQMSVPTPDPAKAGEKVIFQTIIINQGTTVFKKGKYYVETEIYDSKNNYVGKADKLKGNTDINPGETILAYLEFKVPAMYSGKYKYKIYLVHKNKRIIESDYYSFEVKGMSQEIPKLLPVKIGGNMTISYRALSKDSLNNYIGNINLNLLGQTFNRPSVFNLYTFHTPKSTNETQTEHRIFNILYSNYGPNHNLKIGDILPEFSYLSLCGSGMRGIYLQTKLRKVDFNIIGARTTEPEEGTTDSLGIYERILAGGSLKYNILPGIRFGINYVSGNDREDSIQQPGSDLKPARNEVYSATLNFKIKSAWEIGAEYAMSNYISDIYSSGTATDYAYRAEIKYDTEKNNTKIAYQESRPLFYSFGSPGVQNDRKVFNLITSFSMIQKLGIILKYSQWNNNLQNDETKITTIQQVYGTNLSYSFQDSNSSVVTAGFVSNEVTSDVENAQDNFAQEINLGFSRKIRNIMVSLDTQVVVFKDNINISNDLVTRRIGLSANMPSDIVSVTFGADLADIENITKEFRNMIQSYSTSLTYIIVPELVNSQLWMCYNSQKNDAADIDDKIDKNELNVNLEFGTRIKQNLNWYIGGTYSSLNDNIISDSSDGQGVNTRIVLSF